MGVGLIALLIILAVGVAALFFYYWINGNVDYEFRNSSIANEAKVPKNYVGLRIYKLGWAMAHSAEKRRLEQVADTSRVEGFYDSMKRKGMF